MNTNPIIELLTEAAIKRAHRTPYTILNKLPNPYTLQEWAILGTYSFVLMQTKRRLLRRDGLLNLNLGLKETPGAIARDYLNITYKRSPTIKHEQAVIFKNSIEQINNAPRYFKKSRFEHGFYIDIKSTYWTFLLIAGWNLDYYPDYWLSAGRPPLDYPFPENKTARACLVSVARPGLTLQYNPDGRTPEEKFPQKKYGNKVINLGISKLISDVLHAISSQAIALGAVYVNTDGYIAPNEKIAAQIGQMIYDWGLPARVKGEGSGEVTGATSYDVGGMSSRPYEIEKEKNLISTNSTEKLISTYDIPHQKWLQKRFSKLASHRKDK